MKIILFIYLFISSISAMADSTKIQMRVLLLTTDVRLDASSKTKFAENLLRGFHIPFDTKYLVGKDGGTTLYHNLVLTDEFGFPKYYAVILSDSLLSTNDAGDSALDAEQWADFKKYLAKYKVRTLSLETFPKNLNGLRAGRLKRTPVFTFNKALASLDPALNISASIPTENTQVYPVDIPTTNKDYLVAGYFDKMAGLLIQTHPEGYKQMHFLFTPKEGSVLSYVTGSLAIHWLTRGLYIGKRRTYLNAHVDDLYLPTEMNTVPNNPASVPIFRLSPLDVDNFLNQNKNQISKLAMNPNFKIEFAFNADGIIPKESPLKDELYAKTKQVVKEFNWVSHTYTHPNLDDYSYAQVDEELKKNILVAKDLTAGAEEFYSPHSLVTPQISGLFNGEAIRAIKDNGIRSVVGDNSLLELTPPNPHNAFYTNELINGEAGLMIMPRDATDIDYNVSIPEESIHYYMDVNGITVPTTLEDVMKSEVSRTAFQLLNYRESAYMFHQANVRSFSYDNQIESLLSIWIKRNLAEYRKYLKLPVLSVKMDDLYQIYKARETEEDCSPRGYIVILNNTIKSTEIGSKFGCSVDLSSSIYNLGSKSSKYGSDFTLTTKTSPHFKPMKGINLIKPIPYEY